MGWDIVNLGLTTDRSLQGFAAMLREFLKRIAFPAPLAAVRIFFAGSSRDVRPRAKPPAEA
jgi:hypothetical protein